VDNMIQHKRVKGSKPPEGGNVPAAFDIVEIDFEHMLNALPASDGTVHADAYADEIEMAAGATKRFESFSPYPYMVRDIAVFIPGQTGKAGELRDLIWSVAAGDSAESETDTETGKAENSILRLVRQFDEFEKKNKETGEVEKTSYAFRLVFQSMSRTLTEAEVQSVMDSILQVIAGKDGWEVR
jgi:phenylalanyl-tRNA synthetase beta subunit